MSKKIVVITGSPPKNGNSFTMPVYWYSIPAQIKGVIDRVFSLVVHIRDGIAPII